MSEPIMEPPYIEEVVTLTQKKYNPNYGDNRVCECGHVYYRHFDSYEDNYPCGCKYCECYEFKEISESAILSYGHYKALCVANRLNPLPMDDWLKLTGLIRSHE